MIPSPTPSPVLVEVVAAMPAPWRGVPVVAGGFLLLGGVLGFFFNRLQDNRKAKREDRQRWDERIIDLSASVLDSADRQARSAQQIMRILTRDSPQPTELHERQEEEAMRELARHTSTLRLMVTTDMAAEVAAINLRSLELHHADRVGRDAEVFALMKAGDALLEKVRAHFRSH
jgi:hypothetical protein